MVSILRRLKRKSTTAKVTLSFIGAALASAINVDNNAIHTFQNLAHAEQQIEHTVGADVFDRRMDIIETGYVTRISQVKLNSGELDALNAIIRKLKKQYKGNLGGTITDAVMNLEYARSLLYQMEQDFLFISQSKEEVTIRLLENTIKNWNDRLDELNAVFVKLGESISDVNGIIVLFRAAGAFKEAQTLKDLNNICISDLDKLEDAIKKIKDIVKKEAQWGPLVVKGYRTPKDEEAMQEYRAKRALYYAAKAKAAQAARRVSYR